jgi:hypothetical protein
MIPILPSAGSAFERFDLAAAHQLSLRGLSEERAAATLADNPIDLNDQFPRNHYVRAAGAHR